jgi:SAM-dependent methyltransferase
MSFEDVMATVMRWATTTEALAAVGAELALAQPGAEAPPEITTALRTVSTAAGLEDIRELPPPQQAIVLAVIRLYLRQSADMLDDPGRAAGWSYTDPVILDGWGRGSALVAPAIATAHPDLAHVTSFLDVGAGVGLLAVAAASVWPEATIVGVDPWGPSLERAQTNVTQAGLDDRITLRQQPVGELEDVDAFDCAWVPTFFVAEPELEQAMSPLVRAMRPGGWIVLGRMRPIPDPLAEAVASLRTLRGGGANIDTKRAIDLLESAGCGSVHAAPPNGPAPLEFVLGQRPRT